MKTLKFLAQLGMAIICAVLVNGCNSSPSPSDAEKVLSQRIESQSGGQIKLVSFKKTDGQKFVENAIQGYNMDYEAEIEFQSDGLWVLGETAINSSVGELSFGFTSGQASKNVFDQLVNSASGGKQVHRGDHVKIVGVMMGQKKESGWKFESGQNRAVSEPAARPSSSSTLNNSSQVASVMQESVSKEQSESSKEFLPCPVPTESGLWGYINQSGSFIIAPTYAVVGYFIDGFAPVSMSQNNNSSEDPVFSCIDVTGKVALNAVKKNGMVSYVNTEGQTVDFSKLPQVLKNKLIRSCANNLRQIDAAKNQWALEKGKMAGDVPTASDITSYIKLNSDGNIPSCSAGGTYTLNAAGKDPDCSMPGHLINGDSDLPKVDFLIAKCGFRNFFTNGVGNWFNARGKLVYSVKIKMQSRTASQTMPPASCVDILRQIDAAKNQWALENGKRSGDLPTMIDILPYIKLPSGIKFPTCPEVGKYTINPAGQNPECSVPGHVLP